MDAGESRSESSTTPRKTMEPESTNPDSNMSRQLQDQTPAFLKLQKAELIGAKINQTTRRLVVNSITLDNFKSYQGKQTIGPFNDKFVSVIGANGSGKSNLLESLLFIFGHRASKMRLKQLKELIHNSYNYPNIEKATVTVNFDELEESLDGETKTKVDSFSISRNIFGKDSGSDYEINQQASSRAQVVEKLKSKGMDMNNNRFLILQGEVEQISLMKPMTGKKEDPGLLEYLEDIIGSHAYVDQINELEVYHAEAKREQENKLLLVHDVRKELDSMESNKQKAIQYMEAEQKGLCLNHIYHNLKIFETRDKESLIHSKIAHFNQDRAKQREELKVIIEQCNSEIKMLKELELQINKKQTEQEQLEKQLADMTTQDYELTLRQKAIMQELSEANSQIEKNKNDIEKRISDVARMKEDLPAKEARLEKIQKELKLHTDTLTAIMARIQPEIKKFKERIQELQEQMQPFERDKKVHESQKRTLAKTLEDHVKQEARLLEDREKLVLQATARSNEIEKLRAKKDQTEQEAKAREGRLQLCEKAIREIEHNTKQQGEKLREVEAKLNERTTHQEQVVTQNHVLTYLMGSQELRQHGKIYGRIGDLAKIAPQFDIAISATGNQFNNILVESNLTAKESINLLKRDRVGQAHFTALNKQMDKKGAMERPFKAPQDSKRLFDLIMTDSEEVRVVYYNILQNTLVCKDIESAQNIAYGKADGQRYRVVTLEGVIINPDGSMSGGGRPKRGSVKLSTQNVHQSHQEDPNLPKESTQDLIKKKDELREMIEELVRESHKLHQEISKLKSELQRVPQLMRAVDQDLSHETKDHAEITARLNALNQRLETGQINEEKKRIDKEMKALENKILHVDEQLRVLEEQRAVQQSKVDQVGGNELTEARKAHEVTKKDCEVIEVEAERVRAEVKKSEETVKNREEENKELLKRIQTLNLQKSHLIEEKAKAEQKYYEGLQLKSEYVKEGTALKERQQALGESSKNWLASMQQIKGQLDGINSSIEAEQKTLEVIKSDFGKIKEDLEQNRKKFIDFVATFSIIEELKRFDKRDGGGDNGEEDVEDDEDADASFSNTQTNKRNRTQRSAMKRKDLGLSAKKRRDNLEISNITPDRDVTREELEELGFDIEKVRAEITMLKNLKMNLSTDTEVIQIFQQKLTDYMGKSTQLKQVTERENSLRSELAKLKDKRRVEFMTGFSFIAKTLKSVYQTITQGGDADLEPIDNSDPFASGISFNVRPPQKSWKQMSKLSGGEKTLSSLSLIFALHYYKPTPIYFMDEIDAALDFRNVEIVAKFIKERTKDAQFIVISLRNHMFELASQLIGIYKTQDTTKTISIYPQPIVEQVNEEVRRELNESKPGYRLSRRSQALGTQEASAIKSKGFAQSLKARLSVAGQASQAEMSHTNSRPQASFVPEDKEYSSSGTNTRGANRPAVSIEEQRSSARITGRAGSEKFHE